MFEVCACMGTRNEDLRKFGRLLGMLYHGCDDVGDARGLEVLGGGGDEDVRDGILTLPAAFAIRDSRIRTLFCKANPAREELDETARAIRARVPDAEAYLDGIADEAGGEVSPHARRIQSRCSRSSITRGNSPGRTRRHYNAPSGSLPGQRRRHFGASQIPTLATL